jgi:hypothetical protein
MAVEADYLVIGTGAMGMAFTDVLLSETDATVALVDRHHRPGGHWNDAYPFVRLHQPSSFYGVNSAKLGNDTIDTVGWNKGLYELATNGEVCSYFDKVMQRQFLPSGRVQYFPMCDYLGDSKFVSQLSGNVQEIAARKIVDATYMNVAVPSMRAPAFPVDTAVDCVPPNDLPKVTNQIAHYIVIGAGKTGMDTCLFLLSQGVDPANISWIMPRDSWVFDRANIQAHDLFQESIVKGFSNLFEAIAESNSIPDLFNRVEACGQLLRIDETVQPTMYRCATVTKAEIEQLRRINNVIRLGRVKRIEADKVILDSGEIEIPPSTLFIDCAADGLAKREAKPVFDKDHITLQSVRTCQQVFSAAFIGHIESAYSDETTKNKFCTPVPHPDTDIDFLRTTLANLSNGACWAEDPDLQQWVSNSRLDGFSKPGEPNPEELRAAEQLAMLGGRAAERLLQMLGGE